MSKSSQKIIVLYDGMCSLCLKSVRWLERLDWFKRLSLVDYHNIILREGIVPDLGFDDLNRAMHVRFPDGKTLQGFNAIRALCWYLPLCFIFTPFLYMPGTSHIGRVLYRKVAEYRRTCRVC